jgi:hypothetical protein
MSSSINSFFRDVPAPLLARATYSTQVSTLASRPSSTDCRPGTTQHRAALSVHLQHEFLAGLFCPCPPRALSEPSRCCPLAPAGAPVLAPGEPWLRARFSRKWSPAPDAHGPWPWPTPTSAAPARNRLCPRYPPHTALPAHPRRDSSIATSLCRVTAPLSFIGFLLITVPASPF